jgi:phosphodiesterase/alkaline phosphatase D-like protein
LAFAVASCQRFDDGWFPSYGHLAEEDLGLVVHLGDYVYEYDVPADGGYPAQPTPEAARPAPQDLAQWRIRYALYKSHPQLQAAHARFPWAVTWDDHEVRNDYANTTAEGVPDLAGLRTAACWAASTTTAPSRQALERQLGRVPRGPPAAGRGLGPARCPQPRRPDRRLALDVRQRHQASTHRPRRS